MKAVTATMMSAAAMRESAIATATSFGERGFRGDDSGKMREEMLAGNVAREAREGGGGGEGIVGKKGEFLVVVVVVGGDGVAENGYLGWCC